jgi:hypothetical protein
MTSGKEYRTGSNCVRYCLPGKAKKSSGRKSANELRFRPKYSLIQYRDATHSTVMFGFKER